MSEGGGGGTTSHAVNAMTVKLGRPGLTTGGVEGPPARLVVVGDGGDVSMCKHTNTRTHTRTASAVLLWRVCVTQFGSSDS